MLFRYHIYPHTELHDQAVEKGLIGADYWRSFARDPRPDFRMRFWEEWMGGAD